MVQEEAVVERETRIVKCERLALMRRGSGNDDLSDAHIFILGAYLKFFLNTRERQRDEAHLLFAR